jgi:fatty-acyl-CoA synthase
MPGVEDAQVVGVPDPKYGEVVGAFVRKAKGADITESDVQEFARARMARYKAPKYVFFVDEFPLTASGKIQKYKLRQMAADALGLADVKVFASEAEGADPDATDNECQVRQ